MRSAVAASVLLGLALLAAGCGGDDEKSAAAAGAPQALAAGLSAESFAGTGATLSTAGITVVGTGSVTTTPDTAEWSFGVQTSADTADAALAANSEAMKRVVAALREAGIAGDDLQTEQVSIWPRTGDDGIAIVG
jgi:uncharacterized protein YggE